MAVATAKENMVKALGWNESPLDLIAARADSMADQLHTTVMVPGTTRLLERTILLLRTLCFPPSWTSVNPAGLDLLRCASMSSGINFEPAGRMEIKISSPMPFSFA